MMSVTDNKAMIVAIETMGGIEEDGKTINTRDDELIPDIGEFLEWQGQTVNSKKRGNDFSNFIYDTIVPYVEENYNVYTDAAHNAVAGSSFGGLASFYIGMDHPDKFGTIGAFSASFQIYKPETLEDYSKKVIALENKPFVYFYAGGYSTDTAPGDVEVYNYLVEHGYPKDKLVFNKDEDGEQSLSLIKTKTANILFPTGEIHIPNFCHLCSQARFPHWKAVLKSLMKMQKRLI